MNFKIKLFLFVTMLFVMCAVSSAAVTLSEGVQINLDDVNITVQNDLVFDEVTITNTELRFNDSGWWSNWSLVPTTHIDVGLYDWTMVSDNEYYNYSIDSAVTNNPSLIHLNVEDNNSDYLLFVDDTIYDSVVSDSEGIVHFNYSDFIIGKALSIKKEVPTLLTPANGSTETYGYPPLTNPIDISWSDVGAPSYRLLVSETDTFSIITFDEYVNSNYTTQLMQAGTYYWKVQVYYPDEGFTGDWSDVFSVTLNSTDTNLTNVIHGIVYSQGNVPISNAEVTIWNSTWSGSAITGSNGYYLFNGLKEGDVYNLQAKADRYLDSSIALVNATSDSVTNNFYLIDDLTDTEWWHYVEFTLQNVWGVTYPDVATKVYIGTSPTVFGSGNTGSDGTITFHLDQNVEYRITFIDTTLGINEEITLYPVSKSYTVYIDSYSFDLPDTVTDDIQAYIVTSRISATHGYINFTYSDTSDLTTSINYYISDVDGNELYNTSTTNPDLFDSQIVDATDDRYIVRFVGVHPTHGVIDKTETVVFHGGRRVDFGWDSDWQYAVTALAFLIFVGALFGAKTAQYGAITVVMFAWIFKWIGWLDETNTSTLLIILAAVIAFGWSLRKSEEVKM